MATDTYVTRKQISTDFKSIKDLTASRLIDRDIIEYENILLRELGSSLDKYTAKEIVDYLRKYTAIDGGVGIDFIDFSLSFTGELKSEGRNGYAQRLEVVVHHLIDYFGRTTVMIKEINYKNSQGFIDYLQKPRTMKRINQVGKEFEIKRNGCKPQTVKDYIGDIQTLFNAACDKYNDEDDNMAIITHNPFRKIDIKVTNEPEKRDLSVDDLIGIIQTDNLPGKRMQLARDVLLLSFYLVAMNTADLYSEDAELTCRRIMYRRQKTKTRRKDEALISIRIEPEALPLMRKYRDPDKKRLFCFYKLYSDFRSFNKNLNIGCKQLAKHLDIDNNLSTYYMRHTWATIASEDCDISKENIGLALNHISDSSEFGRGRSLKVTRGYINRRFTKIDVTHRQVLDFVTGKIEKN